MYSVYLITNKINNKKYVGITKKGVENRVKQHFNIKPSKRGLTRLKRAIVKYGVSNFVYETLETDIPDDKAEERERYYIAFYNSYKKGYNCTIGGGGTVGYVFTDEVKQKMSKSWCYEKIITPERNQKLSESLKGRKFTEEHKQNMSKSAKAYYKNHDNPFKNHKHTLESKKRMSESSLKYCVEMYDRNGDELLKVFNSINEACTWIKETQNRTCKFGTIHHRISEFIRGKRSDGSKSIYGYIWKYREKVRCND